jgi:hypothetical protein
MSGTWPTVSKATLAELWDLVAAQIEAEGFTVRRGDRIRPGANGETNYTARSVTVRDDLEPAQATRTLVHERAHMELDHGAELRTTGCRGRIEAGMAPGSYSLPYVAG